MSNRYGIYFIPEEGTELGAFGLRWFGRGARSLGLVYDGLLLETLPDVLPRIIGEPFQYGFHATLKPPFRLIEGRTADDLYTCAEAFAAQHAPIEISKLRLSRLGDFLALVPIDPVPQIDLLASACVREFDMFRAPSCEAELMKRRSKGLTENQDRMLAAWGYPYVMDEYRFHMTLTGRIEDDEEINRVEAALELFSQAACQTPFKIDAITVVEQESIDAPFFANCSLPFLGSSPKPILYLRHEQ